MEVQIPCCEIKTKETHVPHSEVINSVNIKQAHSKLLKIADCKARTSSWTRRKNRIFRFCVCLGYNDVPHNLHFMQENEMLQPQ